MINPILPIAVLAIVFLVSLVFMRKGTWNYIRLILILILVLAINIRPSIPSEKVIVVSSNIDVLFVVDDTISMMAEDYGRDRTRLEGVAEHAEIIMDSFEGARYSVVTFDSESNTLVPYTYEKELIMQAITALDGEASAYATGTSLNTAYDSMRRCFRRSEQQGDDKANTEASSNRIQIVFFISDGEITTDDRLRSFADLADYINAGAVLGYGTSSGGYMQARINPLDEEYEYVEYYNDNWVAVRAKSKIDEDNLQDIATDLGVNYYHMVSKTSINEAIEDIKNDIQEEEYTRNEKMGEGMLELYPYIAGAALVLIAYDYIYYRNKLSKEG